MTKYIITIIVVILAFNVNAQVAITIPAEYEKNDKLILVWPYTSGINSVISEITGIAKQVADIEIIYNPDSNLFDTTMIRSFLTNMGIDNQNVGFIPAYTNSFWIRQYSPVTGYGVFTEPLVQYFGNPGFSEYNRPDDDSIPSQLANFWNMELADYGLEFENTNIQYDGLRNLFVGDRIIEQNFPMDENDIRFSLNSYFSSGEVIFMPSLTQSGGGMWQSIDMYMKLIDFETIFVSEIPDTLPDYQTLDDIAADLSTTTNYFGGTYNVIRIIAPPNADGTYPTTLQQEMRTYTNSLILNNIVIIPSYGLPEYDNTAYNVYEKYMPGYQIFMVDASLLTPNYGSIHTITKEIPQPSFLRILHEKVTGTKDYSPSYRINCLVASGDQVEDMWLYYKINSDPEYTRTSIHLVCPQHYADIENLQVTDTVHYYIEANSSATTVTYPLSATEGNFTFWFDPVDVAEQYKNNVEFKIGPNPSNGSFKIISTDRYSKIKVNIYNSVGQLVYSTNTLTGKTIDIRERLKTGYYTLLIKHNNISSKLKLVIVED